MGPRIGPLIRVDGTP